MSENGWLIERVNGFGGDMEYLTIVGSFDGESGGGALRWERCPADQALRFARKQDAAMFVGMATLLADHLPHGRTIPGLRSGDDAPRICEHSWGVEIVRDQRAAEKQQDKAAMSIIDEIAEERFRQIEAEGYSPEHDDKHSGGELGRAAAAYAAHLESLWPWAKSEFKPADARRDLIRAAALIVAEIERLDRTRAPAMREGHI